MKRLLVRLAYRLLRPEIDELANVELGSRVALGRSLPNFAGVGRSAVDLVAEMIYDQNPERWLITYGPEGRRSMVPWARLKETHHARRQAMRDAEKLCKTVDKARVA